MNKVSIIVPVYNVEKYVAECLNSILNQSYKDIEIIVVDDCGTDSSMEIVESYVKQYPDLIHVVHQEKNCGLGAARDLGLRVATGVYIAFVDSDDYVSESAVATYVNAFEQFDSDVVLGGYICDHNGELKTILPSDNDELAPWAITSAWCKMYRKSFLDRNHLDFRGERYYEDVCWTFRLLACRPTVTVISYAGFFYRYNPDSITRELRENRAHYFLDFLDAARNFISEYISRLDGSVSELAQYAIASQLTTILLYNGKGCGVPKMQELYVEYDKVLHLLPKDIVDNKYVSLSKFKCELPKNRFSSWLIFRARKLGLDKMVFNIVSRLRNY